MSIVLVSLRFEDEMGPSPPQCFPYESRPFKVPIAVSCTGLPTYSLSILRVLIIRS